MIEYEVFSARIFKKCVADRAENLDLVLGNEKVDIMQKKIAFQGALTHGDRRATESQDLSRYNIDNKVNFNVFC